MKILFFKKYVFSLGKIFSYCLAILLGIDLLASTQYLIIVQPESYQVFRRIRDPGKVNPATLRPKFQPKLQLIQDVVTNEEFNRVSARYKNNQKALSELADRFNEEEVRNWVKNWFKDSEIEYIQNILRNYSSYAGSEIKDTSGFEKLIFPVLLHLWLDRANAKIVHLPAMHGDGGAELLEQFILSGKETAESQGKEFILLLEYLSLGQKFFISFLADKGLSITLEELFTQQQYRETLREAFKEEQSIVIGYIEDLNNGIMPSSIKDDPFAYRLFSIIIENKIKMVMEECDFSKDTDFEAKRLAMLADDIILEKIKKAVWDGDVDTVLSQSREFINTTLQSMQIRDTNIIKQATGIAKPNTYIQIIMGGGHQLTAKAKNLIQISKEEELPLYYDPLWQVILRKIFSLETEDEEENFLRMFPYVFARYLIKKYSMYLPEIQYETDALRISAGVASRWEKQDCLKLAAALREGEPSDSQAQMYFRLWIVLNGTEEEKRIFKF